MGTVLVVRHGQASFGADDYDVLSPTGWAQARALGVWLREAGVTPTAYVRGGLRRHRETLEGLREAWDDERTGVRTDVGWDEFDHVGLVAAHPGAGEVDLADRRGFQRLFEEATARWTAGQAPPGSYSESYADFVARVRGALSRAAADAGSGETVVVVTSGGPIGVVCAALVAPHESDPTSIGRLWSTFNTVVVNSSLTRVVVGGTGARMLTFNEHPHLRGDLLTYR